MNFCIFDNNNDDKYTQQFGLQAVRYHLIATLSFKTI